MAPLGVSPRACYPPLSAAQGAFFFVSLQSQVREFFSLGSRLEQLLFLGIPKGTEREASFSRHRGLPRAVAVSSRDSGCTRPCGRDLGLEHVQGAPRRSLEPTGHLPRDACPHGGLPPGCERGWFQGWLQHPGGSVPKGLCLRNLPHAHEGSAPLLVGRPRHRCTGVHSPVPLPTWLGGSPSGVCRAQTH